MIFEFSIIFNTHKFDNDYCQKVSGDLRVWSCVTQGDVSELKFWGILNIHCKGVQSRGAARPGAPCAVRRCWHYSSTVKICRHLTTKILTTFSSENKMTTNPCQLTTRSSFVTTDSSPRFQFPMLITWVTTVSSSGSDDNVVIKISHGIVVKMTTKIFTVNKSNLGLVWCAKYLVQA